MEYKTTAKLVIQSCDKDLPGVFGHGCVLLLQGIAREHSINRAAKSMGMAYSKAWTIVKNSEKALGFPLLPSTTGGKGGGGAALTPRCVQLLDAYDSFCKRLQNAAAALFDEEFSDFL